MKKDITELFCFVDDFAKGIAKEVKSHQLKDNKSLRRPTRTPGLTDRPSNPKPPKFPK